MTEGNAKPPMTDDERDMALEEWKLCQGVIPQLERPIYQRQNWLLVILAAITTGALQDPPLFTRWEYFFFAAGVALVFYLMELVQRLPHHRGIQRCKAIEAALRTKTGYVGPVMSRVLAKGKGGCDVFEYWGRARISLPYVFIVLAIGVIAWHVVPGNRVDNPTETTTPRSEVILP